VTAPWEYRDPLEPTLAAEVSSATLMAHVRVIGALERESGSPGEAQAFDYIERTLKSYGMEVERREIEAYISLPQEARLALQQAGALGHVHVLGDHLHNMIVTTIWGTPAPDTAARIPAIPCLSILGADGERLRGLLANGPPRVLLQR